MIDVLGSISLTALFALFAAALIELPLAEPVPALADSRNRGRPASRRTYRGSYS